jgi:cytoskeletal protein RodZ
MIQQNIGSRLENARKSLGITLQQAAEYTKIRSDFLAHIEKNEFDIDLPEIYRQGFLRLYANYLKLDGDEIVKEYRTQNNKPSFAPKTASLHTDLGEDSPENSQEGRAGKFSRHFNKPQTTPVNEELAWNEKPKAQELDRSFLIKFGMIFGGSLVAVLLIAVVVSRFIKSSDNSTSASAATAYHAASNSVSKNAEEEVYLIATGDVHVVVRQESDKTRLFSGTLNEGDRVAIQKKGKIKIHSSAGQNLILERAGKQYGMNAQGVATTAFD